MCDHDPVLVIDAANVVGSRPDGWWRDRAGAARRLHGRVELAVRLGVLDGPVVLVLEGDAREAMPPTRGSLRADAHDALWVVHAAGSGDDEIVALVEDEARHGGPPGTHVRVVTVVTADRGLRSRVTSLGATVFGPSWLLDALDRTESQIPPALPGESAISCRSPRV